MNVLDRILRRLGYVRLPPPRSLVILTEVNDPQEARRLTDALRRELGPIDAELAVLRRENGSPDA